MSFKSRNKVFIQAWLFMSLVSLLGLFFSWMISLLFFISSTILVLFFKLQFEHVLNHHNDEVTLERTQTQHLLNLRQEQLDILMTYYPHPMILFNQKGSVVLSNASLHELVKFKVDQHLYDDRQFPRPLQKLFKQAYYQESPMIQDIALDQQFYSAHCLPIYVNQRYQGFLCVLQDVTRLVSSERLQKRFVADASHELKTPITAIKGISELLIRTPHMEEIDRKDFIQQVFDQSLRLESIVKDMLTLSKLSEDKLMIVKQPNNAKAILSEILHHFDVSFQNHGLTTQLEVSDKTMMYVDKKAFESIMNNLITNVLIHSNASVMSITVEETLEHIIIKINDNGKGIEREHLPHVFDRFYRASSSRQRASGGSGLGLNIARSFVLAHQGSIEVESVLNQGTTFTLSFPKLTLS